MPEKSSFDLVYSVEADGNIPVSKYRSGKTGLTIFIADVGGPLVNGYFCLATEAHDDDGLPHTLEHLIFLGSEEYPYKGVLDLLANRCLASGTNAWTDTDHTCYTMTNAGSEGFLKLLPVYVEHVLYPTLTESGYITEVHHVSGEGENAGVVYCEMQGRENTGESRCHLAMLRALYPGTCGYKSETGGIMKNLRESTSHQKVCDYHRDYYRPENLCLIITGHVKPENVFEALGPLEEKILQKGKLPEFTRPWQNKVPPLDATVEKCLPYPADEEDSGIVLIAFRGPQAKDQYRFQSLAVLQEYLSDTAISPLQKLFVETEDPYCSDVSSSVIENSESCLYFMFQDVNTEKLRDIKPKFLEVMKKTMTDSLDMTRMQNIIHKKVLEALNNVEECPHDSIAFIIIGDFLYGDTKEDLESRVKNISLFKKMKSESEDYWKDLMKSYYSDKPHVVIIGEPSQKEMVEMAETEKKRVENQQKELKEEGLKQKGEQLKNATEQNEKEAPESMLTNVAVPDVSKINFHSLKTSCNYTKSDKIDKFPLSEIPCKFQLDDIKTNFVEVNALLDSTELSEEDRYYLPLFCEVIFESPILRNGELIDHEEVIKQLEADTISFSGRVGVGGSKFLCGTYPQMVQVELKFEEDKYLKGIQWLKDILFHTQFTAERLKIVAQKMANSIASLKRSGFKVVRTAFLDLTYTKGCNITATSLVRQEKFLKKIQTQLDENSEKVLKIMERIRDSLTSDLRIHLSLQVDSVSKVSSALEEPWKAFVPKEKLSTTTVDKVKVKPSLEFITAEKPHSRIVIGVGSVESSFLIQAVPCISDFYHKDLPAVMVFIQYMTQLEGPMWKQIRGLGLAYGYSMYVKPEKNLLFYVLTKSSNIVNAYQKGKNIVMGYINGENSFSEVELESARSSLIFEIIEEEKTVTKVAQQSLLSYFRGVDHNYNKEMLMKIAAVTIEDLKRIGSTYIAPLFDSDKVRTAVCCNPSKVKETANDFKQFGVNLTVLDSLEEDFLSGL
ncbi:uncharacterized protein C05D11.1-like [Mytilus edulis]